MRWRELRNQGLKGQRRKKCPGRTAIEGEGGHQASQMGRAALAGGGHCPCLLLPCGLLPKPKPRAPPLRVQPSLSMSHLLCSSRLCTPRVLPRPQAGVFWEIPNLLTGRHSDISNSPRQGRKNLDPDICSRSLCARQGRAKPSVTTAFPGRSSSHGTHGINYAETIRFHGVIHAETNSLAV